MKDKAQLLFPGIDAARSHARAHPGQTKERGRHYPLSRACPLCFASFTSKGIARHVAACSRKAADPRAILGAERKKTLTDPPNKQNV